MIVSASVMGANLLELRPQLERIELLSNTWCHVDMMDGYFTQSIGFGSLLIEAIKQETELFIDVHLMVNNPYPYAKILAKLKVDSITFHVEALNNFEENMKVIMLLKKMNIQVGISIQNNFNVEQLEPYLNEIDLVLVVCTKIGFGAQIFDGSALKKINWLNNYRRTNNLTYLISVDGGINPTNAPLCLEEGADIIVTGSYLFKNGEIENNFNIIQECL